MKNPIGELKKKILDEVVKASRNFVLREQVRAELQQMILDRLTNGDLKDAEDVQVFIHAMKNGIALIESVPFENWKVIAKISR